MKIIITLLFALSLITCKNNKEASASKSESKEEKKTETSATPAGDVIAEKYRLVVLFFSIGEGAEYPLIIAFEDSIGSYAQKIGKTIDYMKKGWGREGETDFCLSLKELTKSEQDEFIDMTKTQLKKAKWVNIFENYACPKRGGE